MEYNIRKCKNEDRYKVFRLVNQLKDKPLKRDAFFKRFGNNLFDKNIEYWLIENRNGITGFMSIHKNNLLHHDEAVYEIQEFVIDESCRNLGMGSRLLTFALDRFRNKNVELSSNKTRLKSASFYEKHGFKATHNKFVKLDKYKYNLVHFIGNILIFLMCFTYMSCKAQNCSLTSVPFQYIKNQILIDIKLNNQDETLFMFLDTGVDPSVIDIETADRMNLKIERDNEGEASGRGNDKAKVFPTVLDELVIQNENYGNIEALAFNMSGLEDKFGTKVHGILGYSFLKDKIFRIDYQHKVIQFFKSREDLENHLSHNAKKLKFYIDGEDMIPLIYDFKINNNKFIASFDTGSSLNIQIYEHRLVDVKMDTIDLNKLKESQLYGAQGKKKTVTTTIDSFVIDNNIVFNNQDITISSIKNEEQLRMGNIGNKFLDHFKVTFDYVNKEIVLERNN